MPSMGIPIMAQHTGISRFTVHRWFQLFNLQPHHRRHFKIFNDPYFVDKVQERVGFYLRPPDHAVVLCVDEKKQIQALERTQPMLPHREGVTHDNVLFAALAVATGNVLAQQAPPSTSGAPPLPATN